MRRSLARWTLALVCLASPVPVLAADTDATRETRSDEDLARAVERAFRDDPGVAAGSLRVRVEDGIVHLSGTPRHLLEHDRAVLVAGAVRGVRSVVDRMDAPKRTRPDAAVERDVERALATDPVADNWEIEVEVEDGVVALDGEVQSSAERTFAERAAKSVRGVRGIENGLEVVRDAPRRDHEIRADAIAKLRWDRLVDDQGLRVEVKDGIVYLSGRLASPTELARARVDARVIGARAVDASAVEIVESPREDRTGKWGLRPDGAIASAIRRALEQDPRVRADAVDVTVDGGVVTLRGVVASLAAKRAAGSIAQDTVGVRKVTSFLTVERTDAREAELVSDVRAALLRDPWLEPREVNAAVNDGIVSLSGAVDSAFERARAETVAERVPGVLGVRNRITVARPGVAIPYAPGVDDEIVPDAFDWYDPTRTAAAAPPKTDEALARDVRTALRDSVYVDPDEVDVRVDDGRVVLVGEVDSWPEKRAAEAAAWRAGARRVANLLRVED